MYGSNSRQPFWPGMQREQPQGGQPSPKAENDIGDYLAKEQRKTMVDAPGADSTAAGVKPKDSSGAGGRPVARIEQDDDRDRERRKTTNTNVVVIAGVIAVGVGAFVLGQGVIAAYQKLKPATQAVRYKLRKDESEYAATVRRYRGAQEQGAGAEDGLAGQEGQTSSETSTHE